MDGSGEAVATCDVAEPCEFPSLDSCQRRSLSSREEVDLVAQPLAGRVLEAAYQIRRRFLRHWISKAWIFFSHHHHHHQSLNRVGRWGTTDDFATSFRHFSLFSTALLDLPNSRLVHSLPLSALSSSPFHCVLQDGFGQT